MTFQQLRYFLEAVNQASISKAAKELFITQPSLSSAIKELEVEVGVELFRRTPKGIILTVEGIEFLGYARQVIEQTSLLEQRYMERKPSRRLCAISTQHYAFAVDAFVNMVKKSGADEYEFTLRETRTYDIIEDVKTLRSDIGILYKNSFNKKVIEKLLRENGLAFHVLFIAKPHVFVSISNPLVNKKYVTMEDLEGFPCLTFDQGEHNSFYYSEEILSTVYSKKSIRVSDRATMYNLMIGLNSYTISTGVMSAELIGDNFASIPLKVDDLIEVGWIAHNSIQLTKQAEMYIEELKIVVGDKHQGVSVK